MLLADASYVHSLLALETGKHRDALRHAKHCVHLNRRVWASLENRSSAQKKFSRSNGSDSEVDDLAVSVSNMSMQAKKAPIVLSITHESLKGVTFWSFVPSLFRGLSQLSNVFAHQGLFQESIYFAEQACKVAKAVEADSMILQNLSNRIEYWIQGGRADKASDLVEDGKHHVQRLGKTHELVRYESSIAQVQRALGESEEEMEAYDRAATVLSTITSPEFIQGLDRMASAEAAIVSQIAQMKIEEPAAKPKRRTRAAPPVRDRKTAAKPATKPAPKSIAQKTPVPTTNPEDECSQLLGLRGDILRRKAMALLVQEKLSTAAELLDEAATLQSGHVGIILQHSAKFKYLLLQAMKEISTDFTFNVLPESTISFPALARVDRKLSEPSESETAQFSSLQKGSARCPPLAKRGSKAAAKDDFVTILRKARDCVSEIQPMAIQAGSNSVLHQICSVLSHVTVLLSAASPGNTRGALHPLYAAYLTGKSINSIDIMV